MASTKITIAIITPWITGGSYLITKKRQILIAVVQLFSWLEMSAAMCHVTFPGTFFKRTYVEFVYRKMHQHHSIQDIYMAFVRITLALDFHVIFKVANLHQVGWQTHFENSLATASLEPLSHNAYTIWRKLPLTIQPPHTHSQIACGVTTVSMTQLCILSGNFII